MGPGNIYRNRFGKERRIDPEKAKIESEKRFRYFEEIESTLRKHFEELGVNLADISVVGSVAENAAGVDSDLDLRILAPPDVISEEYNQMVKTGKKILQDLQENNPTYELDFWYQKEGANSRLTRLERIDLSEKF